MGLIKEEKDKGIKANPKSILERLVHAVDDETKTKLTDDELRDEVLTMMLAGHETSAHSLAWTLGLLAKHKFSRSLGVFTRPNSEHIIFSFTWINNNRSHLFIYVLFLTI